MPSLLLIVFVFQLLIHLINTVGAPAINNILWILFTKLFPSTNGTSVASQNKLRFEIVRLKHELQSTSSQDEFAKWAKLRRQHDKAVAQYDEQSSSLQSFRSTFDKVVTAARWLGTNGLRTFFQFWFQKRPLFWMPKGWVPGYIEWLLAFPRAPRGSVSIQIWGIACATVIQLVGAAVVAAWVLLQTREEGSKKMKVSARSGNGNGNRNRNGEKKEL